MLQLKIRSDGVESENLVDVAYSTVLDTHYK